MTSGRTGYEIRLTTTQQRRRTLAAHRDPCGPQCLETPRPYFTSGLTAGGGMRASNPAPRRGWRRSTTPTVSCGAPPRRGASTTTPRGCRSRGTRSPQALCYDEGAFPRHEGPPRAGRHRTHTHSSGRPRRVGGGTLAPTSPRCATASNLLRRGGPPSGKTTPAGVDRTEPSGAPCQLSRPRSPGALQPGDPSSPRCGYLGTGSGVTVSAA